MIAKEFENFLLQQEDTFLVESDDLFASTRCDRSEKVCWNYFADRYLVLPNAA